MKFETVPISSLSLDPANARKHSKKNIDAIIASLRRFGQQKPIVVDASNVVRAGNGTLEAAKQLGWEEIAIVRSELQGPDMTAYAIADNRTAELAEWDDEILAATLEGLDDLLRDASGFTDSEIEKLIQEATETQEDEVPAPPANPITKPGDLWLMGDHRLLCGDSTKREDVERLMNGQKADLCFTSPPYGQQRDYTEEGKDKVSDWDGLMRGVFENLPMTESGQVLVNLGLIHRDGEWIPYWDSWIDWMRSKGWRRFGWYVWDQGPGMPGDWAGRFAPSFEFIYHFNRSAVKPYKVRECKHSGEKHSGKGQRGKDGNVKERSHWGVEIQSHAILDSVIRVNRQGASSNAGGHPAPYPVGLPSAIISSWSGDVYEPFCGSGTTLIAAEQLGRKCYGMEISPQYCDVIVKRWEKLTGKIAVRAND